MFGDVVVIGNVFSGSRCVVFSDFFIGVVVNFLS